MTPVVSVVTPVHNTVKYLSECIESVRKQDFSAWEYVILDNASTDGSYEIALQHSKEDPRIRVVRCSELLPQVQNYNRALNHANPAASYIKVLEADNWLFPSCLRMMVELADAHRDVGVVSSYSATETKVRLTGIPLRESVIDGRSIARRHLKGDLYAFGSPTTVMLRSDLVRRRSPYYREDGAPAEDLSACLDGLKVSNFGFVHQVLTFVRTENESILSRLKGFEAQYLDRVVLLVLHGEDFFETDELERIRGQVWRTYYRRLAKAALHSRGARFWEFHRDNLAKIGHDLSLLRLLSGGISGIWREA